MTMPTLSAEPTILSHPLHPNDYFLIFASDGLWEHLSNEQAIEIVHNHPHAGSAKRLVKTALQEAARKREMRYSDLQKIDKKVRRHFHYDITVIVLFLNRDLISRGRVEEPPVSIKVLVTKDKFTTSNMSRLPAPDFDTCMNFLLQQLRRLQTLAGQRDLSAILNEDNSLNRLVN
ncbi:hypothetical protein ACFX2A_008823 [Malus domestica]